VTECFITRERQSNHNQYHSEVRIDFVWKLLDFIPLFKPKFRICYYAELAVPALPNVLKAVCHTSDEVRLGEEIIS
jgi:hypothetical protein